MDYLVKPSHRPFTTGFYFGEEVKQTYGSSTYIRNYDIVGIVRDYDKETKIATIEQKNKVVNGSEVEVLEVTGDNIIVKLEDMKNSKGEPIESANVAKMVYTARCESVLNKDDILIKGKN